MNSAGGAYLRVCHAGGPLFNVAARSPFSVVRMRLCAQMQNHFNYKQLSGAAARLRPHAANYMPLSLAVRANPAAKVQCKSCCWACEEVIYDETCSMPIKFGWFGVEEGLMDTV